MLGYKLILLTTYSRSNVLALLDANFLSHQDIVLITYDDMRKSVARAASLYVHCIDILQLEIPDCIAIEDTSDGVTEAVSAGIRCIGFPTRQTLQEGYHGFVEASYVVNDLSLTSFLYKS